MEAMREREGVCDMKDMGGYGMRKAGWMNDMIMVKYSRVLQNKAQIRADIV